MGNAISIDENDALGFQELSVERRFTGAVTACEDPELWAWHGDAGGQG